MQEDRKRTEDGRQGAGESGDGDGSGSGGGASTKRRKLAHGRQLDSVTDAISLVSKASRDGGPPPSTAGVGKSEISARKGGERLPGVGDRVYSPVNFSESAIGGSEDPEETSSEEEVDDDRPSACPASHYSASPEGTTIPRTLPQGEQKSGNQKCVPGVCNSGLVYSI